MLTYVQDVILQLSDSVLRSFWWTSFYFHILTCVIICGYVTCHTLWFIINILSLFYGSIFVFLRIILRLTIPALSTRASSSYWLLFLLLLNWMSPTCYLLGCYITSHWVLAWGVSLDGWLVVQDKHFVVATLEVLMLCGGWLLTHNAMRH